MFGMRKWHLSKSCYSVIMMLFQPDKAITFMLQPVVHDLQGYGTVRFKNESDVQRAIDEFNGFELEGRNITVKVDQFA
jgi:hypothetical protein